MACRRLLALVCVSVVLVAGGSGLSARSSTWNVATGPTWSNVADLRQSIVTQALHAYDVSSQGGNYPGEDQKVLEPLFDVAYSVLIDYSRCIMAEFYPEAFRAWDESLDKYQHFQATYHDGPKGNDRAEALRWLTNEPKAGGECVFFANLVAARAGWDGYLRYGPTTNGFTRADGTKVHPVPAEYGKVQPGDIVMSTPPYRHAAVVVEVAAAGVTVVESSYLCLERVGKRVMPWDELAKHAYHVVVLDPETPECFGDLAGCRWAAPAIDELAAQNIIQGVAPNVFNASGLVTRAQFATLMQRVFALTPPTQPVSFSDVNAGTWQYDPVQAVTPYMPPVAAGRFAPDEPIDRETVAFVLAGILGAKGELTVPDVNSAEMMLTAFYDAASITPTRRPAVAAVVDVRIMSGFDDGTFQPRGLLTRAQVAVVLQRVLQLLSDLLSNVAAVTAVTPNSGPPSGGIEVVIAGKKLSGATEVRFGTVPAEDFTVDSDSQITATSPPGTGTVNVTVTNTSGTSPMTSDDQFTYKRESTGAAATIACGVDHCLAVGSDGCLYSWGRNMSGQLGTGVTGNQEAKPVRVPRLTHILAVSAGRWYSLALGDDGTVWQWGDRYYDPFMFAPPTELNKPVEVQGLPPIMKVAAGAGHSLALAADGKVWAWGANGAGQIGNDSTKALETPIEIPGLSGVVDIAAGWNFSLALTRDGTVWGWGSNGDGQLALPCSFFERDRVDGVRHPMAIAGIDQVKAVAAGDKHAVALMRDGTVWAWGDNEWRQLGHDRGSNFPQPTQCEGFPQAVAIAAGGGNTMVVGADGTVYMAGRDYNVTWMGLVIVEGFVTIPGLPKVVSGTLASGHCLAIAQDGSIWSWGSGMHGQLGRSDGADVGVVVVP